MTFDATIVNILFEQVQYYYSLGLPHFQDRHTGNKALQEKLANKVDNAEPFYTYFEQVKKDWAGTEVYMGPVAFPWPSYEADIHLERAETPGLTTRVILRVSVSILVDYYSIFVLDEYSYHSQFDAALLADHVFIRSGMEHRLDLAARIERLKQLTEQHFLRHQFVGHGSLFRLEVNGGYPVYASPNDPGRPYTIYDYLFSGALYKTRFSLAY